MSIRQNIEVEQEERSAGKKQHAPSSMTPGRVALAGVLIVVALIAFSGMRGAFTPQPTTQPAAAIAATSLPTSTPATPTPNCLSSMPYVAVIAAHEQAGRWSEATTSAEGALSVAGLCDADRKALTRYAVSDGLKDLYTQVFKPLDREQQQRMVDRYLTLKQRAHDVNVPIDAPLQVAAAAYSSSQFHLSRVAIEEALNEGRFKPETDRDITKMYVSTLYGLGKWYTTADKASPLYAEGLSWLAASDQVAVKFQTGQSEAAMLLSQLGFPDKANWPSAASTPLLES